MFIHGSVEGSLGCFQSGAILNTAAINFCERFVCEHEFSFLWGKDPGMGLYGFYCKHVLSFMRSYQIVSQVATPFDWSTVLAISESSGSSTSWLALGIASSCPFCHSSRCSAAPHCSLDFYPRAPALSTLVGIHKYLLTRNQLILFLLLFLTSLVFSLYFLPSFVFKKPKKLQRSITFLPTRLYSLLLPGSK